MAIMAGKYGVLVALQHMGDPLRRPKEKASIMGDNSEQETSSDLNARHGDGAARICA